MFIDLTSHELRNPLSAICLSAESASDKLSAILAQQLNDAASSQVNVEDAVEECGIIAMCAQHMSRVRQATALAIGKLTLLIQLIDDTLTLSKIGELLLIEGAVECKY